MNGRVPTASRAASIRQRLLDRARTRGEDFQLVLDRYAVERLLYRLSVSPHRDQFLLKGALLFALWFSMRRTGPRAMPTFLASGRRIPNGWPPSSPSSAPSRTKMVCDSMSAR